MAWHQLVTELDARDAERIEAALGEDGALAVTFTDAGDEPLLEPAPGEAPLWRRTRLTALFATRAEAAAAAERLNEALAPAAVPAPRLETVPERIWEREWLRDFRPMRFGGRLWVCPRGTSCGEPDAVEVELDPGLAFGTGAHASTALCLEWLDDQPLAGRRVLDYGCGSGILAIAALRLGARAATGVDLDPQALSASRENAARNRVADRYTAQSTQAPLAEYDVVLANILAGPLAALAETLATSLATGGKIALSGILEPQAPAVAQAYAPWLEAAPAAARDGWVLVTGHRR